MTEQPGQSPFTASIGKLERLHMIKMGLHNSRYFHEWENFVDALLCIRAELNELMDDEQRKRADNFEFLIYQELTLYKTAKKINVTILFQYERYLTDLEYGFGLSLSNKEDNFQDIR